MSDHLFQAQTEASYLIPVFESLRRYDGLTAKRLAARSAEPLLRLPIVQNHAVQTGQKPAAAALEVITEQVRELDSPTDRIIADTALRLGIYLEIYKSSQISKRALYRLGSGGLGERRQALVEHWNALHQAVGVQSPAEPPPGEHTLRTRRESEVFDKLGALLVNPKPTGAHSGPIPLPTALSVDSTAAGQVIVVGGATIDHIWRVRSIPEIATSAMAMSYTRTPGGKGLSQAVAAAHLDLDVALIAAIANDEDGKVIRAHLASEGVDISFLTVVNRQDVRTPATGVFELPAGNSSAAVWRDGPELDVATIDRWAGALTSCDVLLLTFELPQSILRHILNLVAAAPERPVVILTPGQPYADGHLLSPALKQVDYLVAYLWELETFAFSDEARYDPQLLSENLLSLGLRCLCLLGDRGGTVYQQGSLPESLPAPHSVLKQSSITRDSFCAALAARLIEGGSLTGDAIRWAAAAMTSFTEAYREANSHPRRAAVERHYREISDAMEVD
ncbi:sugar/nucleoside kinase (ribokinase family) [Kribbella sp. VKM Ac-2571]|uniref:PfkB family carbohydrate kinase n=1 Tax=Kribbella sp. VKM Ac-2571 TaxID=2512222 RepID=UPI0010617E58|nr:carbohydrate kinase family protein [Kribbella sp. VKM Ac-2571]TDO45480.1 sugar/nucleoside kinase (ribokinase family) [Kribbella sp. VKM Ac-2571]